MGCTKDGGSVTGLFIGADDAPVRDFSGLGAVHFRGAGAIAKDHHGRKAEEETDEMGRGVFHGAKGNFQLGSLETFDGVVNPTNREPVILEQRGSLAAFQRHIV